MFELAVRLCTSWLETFFKNSGDFIEWRLRKHNKIADHVANLTMDHRKSFSWRNTDLLETIRPGNCNILIFSDGGARHVDSIAPGGWVAYVLGGHWGEENEAVHLLASEGVFINQWVSAFHAELTAAESALNFVRSLVSPVL